MIGGRHSLPPLLPTSCWSTLFLEGESVNPEIQIFVSCPCEQVTAEVGSGAASKNRIPYILAEVKLRNVVFSVA